LPWPPGLHGFRKPSVQKWSLYEKGKKFSGSRKKARKGEKNGSVHQHFTDFSGLSIEYIIFMSVTL